MRRQQSITELARVEMLGKPRHMPGSMIFDVDLPPWAGTPRGNAGIDPEFPGNPACIRHRRGTSILRGFGLAGNAGSNPCPYARSNSRLQEAPTMCTVRH
jgi:hypothetical protein